MLTPDSMEALYVETLHKMEATLRLFEVQVPPPQRKPMGDSFVFRYVEQSIHQAIVQKLARVTSGLNAAWILLEYGFVQEQGGLHRVLDELMEDIWFLSCGVINDDITELHQSYLDAFYEEEFDKPEDPAGSTQKRPMTPRQKIQAYLAREKGQGCHDSRMGAVTRTISKAYSGYIHGASPQIMELYGGWPPHFHVSGMRDTPIQDAHRGDLWNYFFRGICAFAIAAAAFGDQELSSSIGEYKRRFAEQSGQDYLL